MKIKTISRLEENYTRKAKKDIFRICRNYAPEVHPFEKGREYIRALNSVKLEKIFARPFIRALEGHRDGIHCLAKDIGNLQTIISGSCDGEVKIWNLGTMKNIWSVQAHRGFVRGVCVSPRGDYFLTCSTDQTVKKWPIQQHFSGKLSEDCGGSDQLPQYTWLSDQAFTSLDHHRRRNIFATGGARVQLWDEHRSAPMDTFEWDSATDTVTSVQFNPVEVEILASSGSDRSICLHDLRMATSIKKVILTMRTNHIAWNPIEAFNFTAANEDSNCYTFDMRRLESALNVHKDHVSAVLSIDYSPTGREFVTGSYDRTIRIFEYNKGHSREIYYTKRMQRVFSVLWTFDAKFVLSGSDETNIRVWKAKAAEKLGSVSPREQTALNYCERLRERYQHHPEIKRIRRHRHVPRSIKKAKELKTLMIQAQKRKEDNRRIHSKPGSIPHTQERKKNIVALKN